MRKWIEWNGGDCPFEPDCTVEIRLKDGSEHTIKAGDCAWSHEYGSASIIAYRVLQEQPASGATAKHYAYTYKGIKLDPYRIFAVYGITHPAQQHVIKRLLRAGTADKTLEREIDEAILALQRWKEMIKEDSE